MSDLSDEQLVLVAEQQRVLIVGLRADIARLQAEIQDALMCLADAPTLGEAVAMVHRSQREMFAAQRDRERELLAEISALRGRAEREW